MNHIDLNNYMNDLDAATAAATIYDTMIPAKRRQLLAGPTQRLATFEEMEMDRSHHIGAIIQSAGMTLLEQIHAEIRANRPQSEKDAEEREQEEARRVEEKNLVAELNKIVVD